MIDIIETVKETIAEHNMLNPRDDIIVALSGGQDSVALLHILNTLKEYYGISLSACHVNHMLRGKDSENDRVFTQNLCKRLKISYVYINIDVINLKQRHESIEECARNARYKFFAKISGEMSGKIATAHNANDNSETVLFNLIRGTSAVGLCGIPPVRDNIIRPLIHVERKLIEEYINDNGLDFVTDKTNSEKTYTRNKIRMDIIPGLLDINPSFHKKISNTTRVIKQDMLYLEHIAAAEYDKAFTENGLSVNALRELDNAILSRVISMSLSQNRVDPAYDRINSIKKIIKDGQGKINIAKNTFAVVKNNIYSIITEHQDYRR